MAGDFARDLGELSGRLDALVPALERMEDRQNSMSRELTQATTNLANMITKVQVLESTLHDEKTRNQNQQNAMDTLQRQVVELKSERDGWVQKTWDVAKLLLAVILGGLSTWGLKKAAGGP